MKIKKVCINNNKKSFEIFTSDRVFHFPYSHLPLKPSKKSRIVEASPDSELGNEAFTYRLDSGKEATIHVDQVLEYNRDPDYLREMLLYQLTAQAQKLIESQGISKREIIRRMGTSPTQFYRLIDQKNYNKTIDQMIRLLSGLDCLVNITFSRAA